VNHAELSAALRSLERELPALSRVPDGGFRSTFEARVARLSAQAEDPDDAVYVIERADTMLADYGWD
jgi:hypothetical protein